MSVDKNLSINDIRMMPNQLPTPELGAESTDTTSAAAAVAPAATALQNICAEVTWVTVQKPNSDMIIMSLHSSVSELLNDAPSDVCVCMIKEAEIIVAYVQNGTAIQNALYVQLVYYFMLHINSC